jgi:hypothetical protein
MVKEDLVVIAEMIEEVIDMDHHNVLITEFL